MSGFESRLYLPGDEEQIVPLLKAAFNGWPFFDLTCLPIDHWRWRYLDNPQHSNNLVEILDKDRIVACGHNVLHDVIINGKKILASYGTDACVHPEYQGKGIYRILVDSLMKRQGETGVKLNYVVTVEPKVIHSKSQRAATPKMFPYRVRYVERIEDINLHIKMKGLTGEYLWRLKNFFDQIRSKPITTRELDFGIHRVNRFGDETNRFIEELYKNYGYIKHRSPEYLNWRYLDPRGGNYNVKGINEDGELAGYAVFRINKLEDYHTGYIVDLLTLPDRIDLAEALLLDGLNHFKDNQVNHIVSQVVEGHSYENLFKQYGFVGEEGNRHIFYNDRDDQAINLENINPERFHFSFGDLTGI